MAVLLLAGGGTAYIYLQRLAKLDAFASLNNDKSLGGNVGIRLQNVSMWHYRGDKLLAEAKVNQVDIRQDRQFFDLSDVYDGVYYGEKNKIFFDADTAQWNAAALALQVTSGATVKSEDFNVKVPTFTFDERSSKLHVPGTIKGRLLDGNMSASNLTYFADNGRVKTGDISWEGKLALQETGGAKTKWRIRATSSESNNGIQVMLNAEATDGEVIVKAPRIERDVKTDVLTATGDVLYFSPKSDVACEKAVIDRKAKKAVLTGNVRMMIKPKDQMVKKADSGNNGEIQPFRPDVPAELAGSRPTQSADDKAADEEVRSAKTTRKYPIAVKAAKVDYWYAKGSRRAEITGAPEARQALQNGRWRQVVAKTAFFDGEKDLLTLRGGDESSLEVILTNSIGEKYRSNWVELLTVEENEKFKTGVLDAENLDPGDEDLSNTGGGGAAGTTGGGGGTTGSTGGTTGSTTGSTGGTTGSTTGT